MKQLGRSFSKKNIFFKKWGADSLFSGKEGLGAIFLTGVENTGICRRILNFLTA
jgi:hypothetical protein